jgi:hypothetical protein
MRFIRRHLLAAMIAMSVLAVAAPVSGAGAQTLPVGPPGIGPGLGGLPVIGGAVGTSTGVGGQAGSFGCGSNTPSTNGPAGGTTNQACGSVLSFIGPSVGEIASVVGPTIIGSTVIGQVNVSAGPVHVG